MTGNRPTERSFGISVGSVTAGVAALLWWRGYPAAGVVPAIVGTLLIVLGRFAPAALRAPNRIWWRFAQTLGWVNTRILLALFFAVVLTPVGVVMRLFGRNPLRALHAHSNWGPYPARRRDPKHYDRMF